MRRFLLIGVVALLSAGTSAYSQEQILLCGDRDEMVKSLIKPFKEKPDAVGVVDKNVILEVFVSPDAIWTMIATDTDGNSCLVLSGYGWDSRFLAAGVDS